MILKSALRLLNLCGAASMFFLIVFSIFLFRMRIRENDPGVEGSQVIGQVARICIIFWGGGVTSIALAALTITVTKKMFCGCLFFHGTIVYINCELYGLRGWGY